MKKRRIQIGLLTIVLIVLVLFISPRPKFQEVNPWLAQNEQPLVMAHAGGKGVHPGNTLKAFKYSYHLGVDVLEMDVHMTLDRILVLRHGENNTGNIRQMSNCDTVIWKETYDYLYRNCNFGYNFEDSEGNYPYRDQTLDEWVDSEVYLTTLEELFELFGDTILYNIEIKADADAWRTETADELFELIEEYNLFNQVLVATSFSDISEYIADSYPELYLSTSHDEARKAILTSYTKTALFYIPGQYSAIQIPTSYSLPVINELSLDTKLLINEAHRHNMAVHYWTINDEEVMRELISLGCDGIITDYPEVLLTILNED